MCSQQAAFALRRTAHRLTTKCRRWPELGRVRQTQVPWAPNRAGHLPPHLPPSRLCSDSTGSYTQVFEKVAAGTYTIRVTAINDNNALLTAVSTTSATTGNLIVGLPGQPRLDGVVGTVGRATITWRLPLFNPSSDPGEVWRQKQAQGSRAWVAQVAVCDPL